MSKDLTPRELYAFEQWNISRGYGSLFDMMKTMYFCSSNGTKTKLYSDESISKRQEFPLLGRLYNSFDDLYSIASKVNGGLKVLARYEKELGSYIQTGQGNRESPLIKWFEGQLDPVFYYNALTTPHR